MQRTNTRNNTRNNSRQSYRESQNTRLAEMFSTFKDGGLSVDDLLKVVTFREKIPEVPYFRQTKSGAVSCHGVKREPIVLYRDQWLKLSKVFHGEETCVFNDFFNNQHQDRRRRQPQQRQNQVQQQHREEVVQQEIVQEEVVQEEVVQQVQEE